MSVTTEQVQAVHTVTELVHAIAYLSPENKAVWESLDVAPFTTGYAIGRAAPMGAVGAGVVHATFYNFHSSVFEELPEVWERVPPARALEARFSAVQAVYERVEAPTDGLGELTELALQASGATELAGRPLAAAHADVPLPTQPFAAAWLALAVLREHRGDGHVATLVAEDVGPVEAMALYAAWQQNVSRRFLSRSRFQPEEAWAAADARLLERGWTDADGAITDEGRAVRDRIEHRTDELAAAPYRALGVDGTRRLFELAHPLAVALNENGGYKRAAPMPDAFPA